MSAPQVTVRAEVREHVDLALTYHQNVPHADLLERVMTALEPWLAECEMARRMAKLTHIVADATAKDLDALETRAEQAEAASARWMRCAAWDTRSVDYPEAPAQARHRVLHSWLSFTSRR